MAQITLLMDGKIPIQVDEDDFEIIKLMIEEVGADKDLRLLKNVIDDLISQGWS